MKVKLEDAVSRLDTVEVKLDKLTEWVDESFAAAGEQFAKK